MPPDSTVTDLDRLYDAGRSIRRPFEPQAFLNVAYFEGRQWIKFDGRQLHEPKLDANRAKITDNRIQPVVRTEIAKMTKTDPVWVGVPRTSSDDDVASARFAENALEWQWRVQKLPIKLRAALLWSRIAFCGYWKIVWDSTKGNTIPVLVYGPRHPNAGKVVKNSFGGPIRPDKIGELPPELAEAVEESTMRTGEVTIDVRSFFQLVADPLATEEGLDSADWLIEECVYSPDYCREQFGRDDLEATTSPSPGIAESRLGGLSVGLEPRSYKGVKVREYWRKPSSSEPYGRYACWAGEELLHEGHNPYPWLPYVMFRGIPVPGRFIPDCVVTQLVPPQTELNKTRSQLAENAARVGNPPLLEPITADEFTWRGLPGEKVRFNPGMGPESVPKFMEIPHMPSYIGDLVTQAEQSIREISGQHEVSAGQVPAGVTAASAISMLQEQDDTRLGPDIGEMSDTLAEAGQRILHLLATYCTDERLIKIAGEDGAWDAEAFKGQMLAGCESVECQIGSGVPQSRAAKQAAIQQVLNLLIQNGKAPDERTLHRILKAFEVGGLEQAFTDISRDERQVNDENRRLARGETFEINSFDNDQVHVEAHNDFRKSAAYDRLRKRDPDVDQRFEEHVEKHKKRLIDAAVAMAGGTGPAPPQAPGQNGSGAGVAVPPGNALASGQASSTT